MKAVDLVTIEQLIPIFKDGNPAISIEVARIKDSTGNSIQYSIVVGRGLYEVGDNAIYIQPDYTIPMIGLFKEYHAPDGDPNKSRLGKKGRVRAIKFNFQFDGSTEPIYSNGILIQWKDFLHFVQEHVSSVEDVFYVNGIEVPRAVINTGSGIELGGINIYGEDFPYQEVLGVEKYVSDDNLNNSQPSGMTKGLFPSFLYKTDEETIENHRKEVDSCFNYNEILSFTQKRDGSSITEYFRINPITSEEEQGICSRTFEKKLEQEYVSAYEENGIMLHPYFDKDTNTRGWKNDETGIFYTNEEITENPEKFVEIVSIAKDAWVDTDKKYGYLEKFTEYCKRYNLQMSFRGELVGAGNKGSGNKLNSDAKTEAKVIWFGVDDLSSGVSRRIHYGQEHNLAKVCEELELECTGELFSGIYSYDQIIAQAHEYFKTMKETTGIVVEGVVIRTKFSNNLSVKYINPEYDAKS